VDRGLMILRAQPQYLVENLVLYLGMIFHPLGSSVLSALPLTGTISLVAAIVLAWRKRETALWWVIPPLLVSQLLVVFGALMIGQSAALLPSLVVSGLLELALIGWLIYRCRRSRLAGVLAGWFAVSFYYATALDALLFFVAG